MVVAVEDSATGARSAREAGLYVVGYIPDGGAVLECDRSIAALSAIVSLFETQA
jgi:beta-phosphoglucomutase-like phosphatase (HAD superfamily)